MHFHKKIKTLKRKPDQIETNDRSEFVDYLLKTKTLKNILKNHPLELFLLKDLIEFYVFYQKNTVFQAEKRWLGIWNSICH